MIPVCRMCRRVAQRIYGVQNAGVSLYPSTRTGVNYTQDGGNVQNRGQCHSLSTFTSQSRHTLSSEQWACTKTRTSTRWVLTSALRNRSAEPSDQKNGSSGSTIDEEEVNKFSSLADLWWDEAGEFEALHSMNELRVPLIRDALVAQRQQETGESTVKMSAPLQGLRVLDVGSGGGILSEPLARLGASVVGVDASEENIRTAQAHMQHDPAVGRSITYIQATVEDLVAREAAMFDGVVASEVVEHVADVSTFVTACCQLVKPGGSIFLTTLNKTYLSYALGVVWAENLLHLVSPGTHDWNKFISPQDLQYILDQNDFSTRLLHGMMYNPLTKRWSWIKNTSINYAIHAVRAHT